MYKIVENNFETGIQREVAQIVYLDRAKQLCEDLAINYVLAKEGLNYFKRALFHQKDCIKKGYALVLKETNFYKKITVFYKEPNGIIYSGQLKKITQFVTVSVKMPESERRTYYDEHFNKVCEFDEVLMDIKNFDRMNLKPINDDLEQPDDN